MFLDFVRVITYYFFFPRCLVTSLWYTPCRSLTGRRRQRRPGVLVCRDGLQWPRGHVLRRQVLRPTGVVRVLCNAAHLLTPDTPCPATAGACRKERTVAMHPASASRRRPCSRNTRLAPTTTVRAQCPTGSRAWST